MSLSSPTLPRKLSAVGEVAVQDIVLWKLIHGGSADPQRLAALLGELADLPATERWPFMGRTADLARHSDPAVRAAALRVLGGATGHAALKTLVAALFDKADAVRDAALAALRSSSTADPERWIHALYHPDAAVRAAAARQPPGGHLPWVALPLLMDDDARQGVLDNLPSKVPSQVTPLILDLVKEKMLARDAACEMLCALHIDEVARVLQRTGLHRSPGQAASVLEIATKRDDALELLRRDTTHDAWDDLLLLFWDPSLPPDRSMSRRPGPHDLMFERLCSWVQSVRDRDMKTPLLASVFHVAAAAGWDARAAELALLACDELLDLPWVDLSIRRESIRSLYRFAANSTPRPPERVRALLKSKLCIRNDKHLDLWAIGGILHWAGANRYELASSMLGPKRIAAAFLAHPVESAPFFTFSGDNPGRQKLIEQIAAHDRWMAGRIIVSLVMACNADALEFLDNLDADAALDVYSSLMTLTADQPTVLNDRKIRRLAETLGPKLATTHRQAFVRTSIEHCPRQQDHPLLLRMLGSIAQLAGAEAITATALRLGDAELPVFLDLVTRCPGFPFGAELHLAVALGDRIEPKVRQWVELRIPSTPIALPAMRTGTAVRPIDAGTAVKIASCSAADLDTVVKPFMSAPCRGLTAALQKRTGKMRQSVSVCVALLGCHDTPEDIAAQFVRFSADEPGLCTRIDALAVENWAWNTGLPLLGNCWLHLWDQHCFAAGDELIANRNGLPGALDWADKLPSVILRRQVYEVVQRLIGMWRFRDKARLGALNLDALCESLVSRLALPMGLPPAKALISLWESGVATPLMQKLRPKVVLILPELEPEVRQVLNPWIDSRGLLVAAARVALTKPVEAALLAQIARSDNVDELEQFCRDWQTDAVQEATLRLIELGDAGIIRLAKLLQEDPEVPLAVTIAESIPLWPAGDALIRIREHFHREPGSTEALFVIGATLYERGQHDVLEVLLQICRRPVSAAWFEPRHWDRLLRLGVNRLELSISLATSPHPHAYQSALGTLLAIKRPDRVAISAVVAFLESDSKRLQSLRQEAANWLRHNGDYSGLPLLVGQRFCEGATRSDASTILAGVAPEVIESIVAAVLAAGPKLACESRLLPALQDPNVPALVREEALARILQEAEHDHTRVDVVGAMRLNTARSNKVLRLARTFAWGIVTGRELTGRIFTIEMVGGQALGYTRFEKNKVWITPLPLLRGERDAEPVTRGLIVHEFGHHMYHRGPEALEVWKEAELGGYHGLLNLVSDEHLERNLRSVDADFGDDLKKLATYAFQRSQREIPIGDLLMCLKTRAVAVLTCSRLAVARKRGCVTVDNGAVLLEMERAGISFARFVRALRMGLGNRHRDPKVAQALKLFTSGFRSKDMSGLRDITLRLREIFGWEAVLMESFSQDQLMLPDGSELIIHSDGISKEEVNNAIERILDARKGNRSQGDVNVRVINVGHDDSFSLITTVQPVPFVPDKHAVYVRQVARQASQMRQYFSELGIRLTRQRMRLQGRSLDKTRIVPAVLRGDPRMLIARQRVVRTDLFLGLVIDCSGSMQISERIEKAKLFGTLLATAGRGLTGIDVRIFGFTDSVIYDAGDADHCAAHSLESGGGNNDAAALWHAACVARASRRKAKLLVMISDGSPTECTVAALKGLVNRLTRRMHICCAQVAVCPLEHKCFPHYVEVLDEDFSNAVRHFGSIITRLVQQVTRM